MKCVTFVAKKVQKLVEKELGYRLNSSPTEADELVDGEITVNDRVSIQVGEAYLIVCEDLKDGSIVHHQTRNDTKEMLRDLKKVLASHN